ncbi:MAG: site-2 protease family protein [Planctomycetota bacterium]
MFGQRFTLFNLRGFPVRADVSWLIVLVLVTWSLAVGVFPQTYPEATVGVYWMMGLLGALGLFASIVVHEFAHAAAAQRHGLSMKGITLFLFGGVAEMSEEPPSPKAEFQVAVAGPVASVLIGGALLGLAALGASFGWHAAVLAVLSWLGLINLVLVVFNILPAFPLDGGRVLRSALWYWKGSLRWATRVAAAIGGGFGILLVVLGVFSFIAGNFLGGLWLVLIGVFLRGAAQMSYSQLLLRRALEGEPVARFVTHGPITVSPNTTVADLVENYIYRHHHRMFPVADDGRLVGCVSARQIKDIPRAVWNTTRVADILSPCSSDNTIRPDTDAVEALRKMQHAGATRLIVVEGGNLVGMLTMKDLLRFISLKVELEEGREIPVPSQE